MGDIRRRWRRRRTQRFQSFFSFLSSSSHGRAMRETWAEADLSEKKFFLSYKFLGKKDVTV